MNALAQGTMKNAAKCESHCELQNSVNQQVFECKWYRKLCLRYTSVRAHIISY